MRLNPCWLLWTLCLQLSCCGFTKAQTVAPRNQPPQNLSVKSPVFDTLYNKEIALLPLSADRDTRLQRAVTFSKRSIALMDFVEELTKQTQVNLALDRDLLNRKTYVHLTNRPLRDVLTNLAEMYGSYWMSSEKGYILRSTPEAIKLKRLWWQTFGKEQSDFVDSFHSRLQRNIRRPLLTEDQIALETNKDIRASIRLSNKEQKFWNSLNEDTVQQLLQQQDFSILYLLVPFISKTPSDGGIYVPLETFSQDARDALLRGARKLEPSLAPNNYIGCLISSSPSGAHASPVNWDGHSLQKTDVGPTLNYIPETPAELMGGNEPPYAVLLDQRLLWKSFQDPNKLKNSLKPIRTLVAFQNSTYFADSTNPQDQLPSDSSYRLAPYLPDCLDEILEKETLDCLADIPSLPVCRPIRSLLDNTDRTLGVREKLSKALRNQDVSWKEKKGFLIIRHNRWYRNDSLEGSPEAMQKLCDTYHKIINIHRANRKSDVTGTVTGSDDNLYPLTLQEAMDMAATALNTCNVWQIANGMTYYVNDDAYQHYVKQHPTDEGTSSEAQPLAAIAKMLFSYPQQCSFYRTLSSAQRKAYIEGSLRFSELSPTQQKMLEKISGLISTLRQTRQASLIKLKLVGDQTLLRAFTCTMPDNTPTSDIFGGLDVAAFRLSTSIIFDAP